MTGLRNLIPPPAAILVFLCFGGYFLSREMNETTAEQIDGDITQTRAEAISTTVQALLTTPNPGIYENRLREASGRPLFSETRRRPEADIVVPVEEIAEPEIALVENDPILPAPQLTYLGYIDSNGAQSALIIDHNSDQELWISVGDELSGWVVSNIAKNRISLTHKEHSHVVDINL